MVKRWKAIGFVGTICALVLTGGCRLGPWYKLVDTWNSDAHQVKMRVRKFSYRAAIAGGRCYYIVDAAVPDASGWKEILGWENESCPPIRRERVQFIGDRVVYAYNEVDYAVTTDAGAHWSTWNVNSTQTDLKSRAQYIQQAQVSQGGIGRMVLYYYPGTGAVFYAQYQSTDYGLNWTKQPCDSTWPVTMPCKP